jgi:hypothetical protein
MKHSLVPQIMLKMKKGGKKNKQKGIKRLEIDKLDNIS